MQIRRGTQVNRNTEDHTLHVCRKVPSGYDQMGALSPSRHVRAQTVLWAPTFVLQCYGRWHFTSDMNPNGNIRHPLRFRRKLMPSIVMNVGPLHRLLLVGSRLSTLVHCSACRGRMGHDHLLIKSKCGIINDRCPVWSYPWHHQQCQHD